MPKLYVLLENIRSAYNVGSLFRTSDAAGIEKLYLTGYTAFPPHPKLKKTALGATQTVEWEHYDEPLELVKKLKKDGVKIISLEVANDASSIFKAEFKVDTCLIFGNEVSGVSKELIEISDEVQLIPQFGEKSSLNIASAAAIAIYEYQRKASLV